MADVDRTAAQRGPYNFITDIYDCAVDPARWSALLCKTSLLLKGCAAAIISYTPSEDVLRFEARWNVSAKLEKAISATAPLHPAVPAVWLLGVERPIIASAFLRDGRLARSHWHKKTLQPEGMEDAVIVPLTRTLRTFSTLMIMRKAESGTYQAEDLATIAALTPHFRQAAAIAGLLGFSSLADRTRRIEVNRTSVPIILTDGDRRIVSANEAGQRILDGCALLCLDNTLSARDRSSDIALREAVARAAQIHRQPTSNIELPSIRVKGLGGAYSLAVSAMPLSEDVGVSISGSTRARIAVFARILHPGEPFAPASFSQPRVLAVDDARIWALLAQGLKLEEAAWTLAMPVAAARASLARLLVKMQGSGETELIARVRREIEIVSA